jgi:mannose-6-phosphate isomerase-like protein (cupin superfamily)
VIKYLKLPVTFDAVLLQQEVHRLSTGYWKQHYNKKDYEGSWSVIPLRSLFGNMDANFSIQASANPHIKYLDTELMQHCPYIQEVLTYFDSEKLSVRLMNLSAGAIIKEHKDDELNLESGEARFHIPVQTNAQVSFFVDDELIPLKEGECWYLNLSLKHRVRNEGTTDRIHLVVDCVVNDWVKAMAARTDIIKKEFDFVEEEKKYSAEEKAQIIAQLKMMGTDAGSALAAQMEATIK